ncbi:hypothetical protein PR202_ga10565 [Eleusine coracana subsp. coracana]|uniref:Suppressor of forked domain-containing protein n=1 Tax=Eleusine coracana subsp. coracana TaxID=191504 RepID=A0AAV5C772_ELECO|nr:hypothetical protein PR202_ga10565 [Eleusine coracana subsp. coracana]
MPEEAKTSGGGGDSGDIYNVQAAEILANEARLLPINEAAPIYEKLLATFPTAAKYWKQYVEAYIAANNNEATKQIFSRCLLNCLHINLWRCYINFIRRVNDKRGSEGLDETKKAFDFMLNYVGNDAASGPVWMEYIAFLKSMPAVTPHEESHRMTTVRKVYQKAILVPTNHVEQLWKDYENFENSVSRTLAKGLLSEYQPKFNSAKAVYRERKKYIDDIDWNVLAIPPTGSYKEEQQCMAWKRLLAFEKGNPQRIDAATANRRVTFTYEQCLMYLYHHPDIWYDYATWHAKNGSVDSAAKIFQRALKAIPDSEVLKYAYAEMEEARGAIQAAKTIYESLIAENANVTSLAHIQFIRFLRRTEGIEAARKYFLDARKSSSCTYHVYVAYATMAFCLDKDAKVVKVAQSVFEAGLKRFMHEPGYILEYADFLCRLNDDRNVRALFERALSLLPPEESIEVWKRFVQFEQTYGDLSSMLKLYGSLAMLIKRVGLSSEARGPEFSAGTHSKEVEEILKMLTPSTMSFVKNLPAIEGDLTGPSPDIDVVLSVLLQSTLPVAQNVAKAGGVSDLSAVGRSGPNQNGSVHRPPRDGQSSRRKDIERQGAKEEEDAAVKSRAALPRDVFRLRQIQKSRGGLGATAATQSGSSAFSFSAGGSAFSGGGSAFSGDQSASTD